MLRETGDKSIGHELMLFNEWWRKCIAKRRKLLSTFKHCLHVYVMTLNDCVSHQLTWLVVLQCPCHTSRNRYHSSLILVAPCRQFSSYCFISDFKLFITNSSKTHRSMCLLQWTKPCSLMTGMHDPLVRTERTSSPYVRWRAYRPWDWF